MLRYRPAKRVLFRGLIGCVGEKGSSWLCGAPEDDGSLGSFFVDSRRKGFPAGSGRDLARRFRVRGEVIFEVWQASQSVLLVIARTPKIAAAQQSPRAEHRPMPYRAFMAPPLTRMPLHNLAPHVEEKRPAHNLATAAERPT
jgi:hypothetical protein